AGAEADAVEPAGGSCLLALALERVVAGEPQQLVERLAVVAGVEDRPGRGFVRKGLFRHEIAPAQFGRVDAELARRDLHHALEREVELWSAIAAVETDRRL